ncbi:hypothetical protein A2303_01845 [Candidatus Falkowbacteria bacterium RIFOXYB2_FULL_47_14]|uniref:S-adenosylmethionine decarboxylase n=1 Tax=Candidatus Falkowbacteria bacterium RIFOXYA2_FULL_47_19 TaxID=1797994 RepID=A0A1F5SKU9_9BACT|nr:MAG: hypothetical protein A2227_06090 [Candidatus Falkowbacteria bacterium RIFOXYA2_FULL_47_19]OGF37109.1 MAG: hypothetical protein A2468_05280 [Candidatus Falkowbacteria bacterium RIFOXYC2_FULL_46_15]OGF43259.1 MAG: hypothetical protein A2303_01845 [Candidatus Falkowbacteria bacterium RIFOXYB2_FULL_47_14]
MRLYKNIINLIKRLRVHEWGMSVHLDLQKCNAGLIRSPGDIKRFIVDLCRLLEMQRFGDAEVHRFGSGHKEGYTAIQKIYDSAIVVHFEEIENRAFLDIFSCKSFDEIGVEKFCEDFFGAKKGTVNVLARG